MCITLFVNNLNKDIYTPEFSECIIAEFVNPCQPKNFHTHLESVNNASMITGKMFTRWTSLDYRILGDYKITASSSFDIWASNDGFRLANNNTTSNPLNFTFIKRAVNFSKRHKKVSVLSPIGLLECWRGRYAVWGDYHCANTSLFTLPAQETPSRNINNFIKYLRYAIINS